MRLIKPVLTLSVVLYLACSSINASELKITADTNLPPSGKLTYAATNLIDEKIETAWCAHGEMDKSVFVITPERPLKFEGIGIFNGYQKNRHTYLGNSRPGKISIQLNGGIAKTYNLNDELGVQWLAFEPTKANSVRVEISKIFRGSRYNDVCVSEFLLDRQVYEAYVLMQKLVGAGSGFAAMKPVFDIYDANRRCFTNALTLIGGQRNTASLKFILNLAHYAENHRATKDAELQEGLRDMIIPYIENSPEVVFAVLNTDKQVALERIDSAYVQYIDQFSTVDLERHRNENIEFAKLMDVIELRLSNKQNGKSTRDIRGLSI